MGRGVVKTQTAELVALAQDWAEGHGLAFEESPSPKNQSDEIGNVARYEARGRIYLSKWQVHFGEDGATVDMKMRVKPWLSISMGGVLLLGLGVMFVSISGFLRWYTLADAVTIVGMSFLVLLLLWLDWLAPRNLIHVL